MHSRLTCAALGAALVLGTAAQAAVIFEDDFSGDLADNGGAGSLNFNAFNQFSVSDGTVDLIGSGEFGITCGVSGACVDLDGSTGNAGVLTSSVLNFLAGVTYTLEFSLSGNQRTAATETGLFGITNGILSQSYSAASSAFSTTTVMFSVAADTSGSIFFADDGNDNIGAVLDYVRVSDDRNGAPVVPLPASALLLLGGLGGLAAVRRRPRG